MNRIKQSGFTVIEAIFALIVLTVGIGGAVGWVKNIIKIAGSSFQPLLPLVVIRIIGVFIVPLGAVLGYIG